MKKQLLCTSAIALGVAAAPATAQDWNLDWGGFFNTHVAIGDISVGDPDSSADFDGEGLDIHTTGEIIFTPSITLDNGLTFGVNVQFEAQNTSSSEIDESYITISSDTFGQLDIGHENSAGYKLMTGAPSVTSMFINSPSTSAFIPFTGADAAVVDSGAIGTFTNSDGDPTGINPQTALPFRQAGISSFTEVAGNNDVNRITYYTPDFNGLTIGVSYAPTGAGNVVSSLSVDKNSVLSDIFDIGVNYSGSFGTTDITLAARYGTGDSEGSGSDPETWGIGFSVTFGAVTVGGSYAENDNDESLITPTGAATLATGISDSEGWSLGVVYDAPGPWAFEALGYISETDYVVDGAKTGDSVDREAYKIGASRDLGPGVDWDIYLVYEERDNDATDFTDIDGLVLGTAINLSF